MDVTVAGRNVLVPEPYSVALFGAGLGALLMVRRRIGKNAKPA